MSRLARILIIASGLTVAAAPAAHAAFPGENGKLAFDAYVLDSPEAGDHEVFTIEPDGSGLVRITDDSAVDDFEPEFSPDGRRLAYVRSPDTANRGQLNLMDPDGSDVQDLGHDGHGPAWSPDGSKLAFHNLPFDSFNYDLFTLDLSSGAPVQFTQASSHDAGAAWSPDGSTIAFHSTLGTISSQSEIYSAKSDGSEDWVKLTSTFGTDAAPEWSPDGAKIAFVSNRNGGNSDVFVMNADGSAETRLTIDPQMDLSPQWSPDGTKIAFTRYDPFTVTAEIWTMNPDGTGQEQQTDNSLVENLGDWQPVVNQAPDCSSVEATPAQINRHNRTFVTVALSGATDPDGDPVTLEITGVTQDEPVGPQPDARAGDTPDIVRLRAERDNRGDGRVYRIAFEVADGNGGGCSGDASVGVPRRRNAPAVDSAPPSYDSFGS